MFLDLICVLRTKSDDFKNLVTKVIQLNLIFLLIRFDQKEQKNSIMNEKLSFISKRFKKPLWEIFFTKAEAEAFSYSRSTNKILWLHYSVKKIDCLDSDFAMDGDFGKKKLVLQKIKKSLNKPNDWLQFWFPFGKNYDF